MENNVLFLGIKGSVVALNKKTGKQIWKTHLKSSQYVTITQDKEQVYAHTNGELFCLQKKSGKLLWKNGLSGLGYGYASIAINNGNEVNPTVYQAMQSDQSSSTASAAGTVH
ncbi:hypothetical protein LNTAR_19297 [Lentisphaera araneosa HTCC2155]|uniref:Pyrrolo-quinoline quinone repeat domain-containing protein n=1 Tax=Lentisphaera araneosa HTCC2155 TaxID=313628 RepID=A6DQS5_9BACT|nr:PQQ-binding-like beta-propeller repeat protein [Lentisphaera araneosa]EDM25975.1 hypothetical protein LNTAR_19297 [Lentisphaera araneosa HTCC2155]